MKIKDVVKINELNINSKYPYSEIEYIDTASLTEGRFEKIQHIQLKDAPSRAKRIVRHNDILISTVRPNLKHYGIAKNPSSKTVASTGFAVITCKKICPDYLYRLLTTNWYTDFLSGIAESQQSNYPAFNPSLIENTTIDLPELPIQRKIAAVLSTYHDLIENNNRRIAILEKMAEELYREWFVRLRFPGHEKVKIVKGVPEGWEIKTLGEICFEERKLIKKKNISDEARYIGLEHISPRTIITKDYGYAVDIQSDKLVFSQLDILFGKIRPYLHKVSIAHFNGVCSSDIIVIKSRRPENQVFVYLTVSSNSFIDLATTASTGTKMPRADWDFLIKQKIVFPDIRVLQRFQNIFDNSFSAIINYQKRNEVLQLKRDRLLSRLMSGKIDVENMNIQFPDSMKEEAAAHA
jgi:type I restriction enzyme S subunit